jgi:methylmalonyl-CoA mutase N-terminal domain/subunit
MDVLSGTIQNDILKEYIARGTYIFPPKPSMRLITDIFEFCSENVPKWNTISISGYHIREAGSTAAQEVAFTLADGIAYVEAAARKGLDPNVFGERLSFFFNAHNDFLEEVAKFRAARRMWARIMKDRFGEGPDAPVPHPDGREHPHSAAARKQHCPRNHAGPCRRSGRNPVPPYEQHGRGAGPSE